jgi:hypothetical protein
MTLEQWRALLSGHRRYNETPEERESKKNGLRSIVRAAGGIQKRKPQPDPTGAKGGE